MISWVILGAALVAAAAFFQRMKMRTEAEAAAPDEGQAILDFNRAFPDEPIRAIHATVDGSAYVVRLHDGKAGMMLSQGAHFICHLMDPGRVQATPASAADSVTLHFLDHPRFDGTYRFESPAVAAEIALWILGSFTPSSSPSTPIGAV